MSQAIVRPLKKAMQRCKSKQMPMAMSQNKLWVTAKSSRAARGRQPRLHSSVGVQRSKIPNLLPLGQNRMGGFFGGAWRRLWSRFAGVATEPTNLAETMAMESKMVALWDDHAYLSLVVAISAQQLGRNRLYENQDQIAGLFKREFPDKADALAGHLRKHVDLMIAYMVAQAKAGSDNASEATAARTAWKLQVQTIADFVAKMQRTSPETWLVTMNSWFSSFATMIQFNNLTPKDGATKAMDDFLIETRSLAVKLAKLASGRASPSAPPTAAPQAPLVTSTPGLKIVPELYPGWYSWGTSIVTPTYTTSLLPASGYTYAYRPMSTEQEVYMPYSTLSSYTLPPPPYRFRTQTVYRV